MLRHEQVIGLYNPHFTELSGETFITCKQTCECRFGLNNLRMLHYDYTVKLLTIQTSEKFAEVTLKLNKEALP